MKKVIGIIKKTASAAMMVLMVTMPAMAEEPKIFSGTNKLAQDCSLWAMGLIPALCVCFIIIQYAIKTTAAGDHEVATRCDKIIKRTMIAAVAGFSVSGVVACILSYYK